MALKICIIDDNAIDVAQIKNEIVENSNDNFDPHISYISNVDDLSSIPFAHIYFIDIDMPIHDGFTVASYLLEADASSCIIFVTNHEDLVYNSYSLNTFYFARKSSLKQDIKRSIDKYLKTISSKNFIIIEFDHDMYQIVKSDIMWIESNGNNLSIHTKNYQFEIRRTLKSILENLDNYNFLKIHNSYLVNLNYIQRVHKNNCHLLNGTILPISLSNKKTLLSKLKTRKCDI